MEGSLSFLFAEDLEQYEPMKAAYLKVGQDFDTQEELLGEGYAKLLRLETVPRRWPLARLSIPLQRIVDHLDCVVAGCCWKVLVVRLVPDESLASLRRATKRITMTGYLTYEVAAILREILTYPTKQLYDDTTAHLLCSNYWIKPIYQKLLHFLSRYNATLTEERKRPASQGECTPKTGQN